MKKILSFILTVAMLASMVIMPAGADTGNAAYYFNSTDYTGSQGLFMQGYVYNNDASSYFLPDANSGDYNFTMVMDLNVESYAHTDAGTSGIYFVFGDLSTWSIGYCFDEKAFVLSKAYMANTQDPGTLPPEYIEKIGYDLEPGEWYEIAVKYQGRAISMYVNGVKMFTYDSWDFDYAGFTDYADYYEWARKAGELHEGNFQLTMMVPVSCAFYADNLAIYSGDYDFANGTASTTYATANDGLTVDGKDKLWGPFSIGTECGTHSANGGTEKVTYDREFAASHTTHALVYDAANSKKVSCTEDGYDLYACSCGASEYKNYQKATGHNNGNPLSGRPVSTLQEPTATDVGVKTMICQTCGNRYTEVFPLTGTDKGLKLTNNGLTNFVNGYFGLSDNKIGLVDDGFFVSFDVMTISHRDNNKARIGAFVGGQTHTCYLGYDFSNSYFYVEEAGKIVKTVSGEINTYEWNEWGFRRSGRNVTLYIDGEEILTYEMSEKVYEVTDLVSAYQFYFLPSQTDLILDNALLADPDYDIRTNNGYIYEFTDFTKATTDSLYVYSDNKFFTGMLYSANNGAGYTLASYGRTAKTVTEIHREMAISIDSDYANKSANTYSDFYDNDAIKEAYAVSSKSFNLEYSLDFNITDWCTDTAILGTGNDAATAMIGSHVNSLVSNGFAGYDFTQQRFVIGSNSGQANAHYTNVLASKDYAIGKNEWHTLGVKYSIPVGEYATVTITLDGKEVLSYTYDDDLTMEYLILYPNYIKGYIDNVSVNLNNLSKKSTDFTNASDIAAGGLSFTGAGYKLVNAPVDDHCTHVYSKTVYPAGCTSEGYTVYTCSCGGSTYTRYDQPAAGHSWDDGVVKTPATSTSTGVMLYTCTVCKDTKEVVIPKEESAYGLGDVNGDGKTDSKDATLIIRKNSNWNVDYVADVGDANGDGKTDSKDATLIIRKNSNWNVEYAK